MFSLTIPCFWQYSTNLFLTSSLVSGSRAVGRVTGTIVSWVCHWGSWGGSSRWMGKWTALIGVLRWKSWGWVITCLEFYILRICSGTMREVTIFPSPSLRDYQMWASVFRGAETFQDKFGRTTLSPGSPSFLPLPTPRWVSEWKYSTRELHHLKWVLLLEIHKMKYNVVSVVCFNYPKYIVSIICGGNRKQLRACLVHRKQGKPLVSPTKQIQVHMVEEIERAI